MRYSVSRLATSLYLKDALDWSFFSHSVLSSRISDGFTINLVSLSDNRVVDLFTASAGGLGDAVLPLLVDMKVLKLSRHSCRFIMVVCFRI